MNYRALGRSGLMVSEISLGSWTTYGGSLGVDDTTRIVHRAFECGVNLYDTADVYVKGEAERALAVAIRDLPREQLVIATMPYSCGVRIGCDVSCTPRWILC